MSVQSEKSCLTLGKIGGSSPADDLYYVLIFFDISDVKKYRLLIRILKNYSLRIQKSIFEAHLKRAQIKKLVESIDKLMSSKKYINPSDNVRIYRISGNCEVTVFGTYESTTLEENIFI
ncbi:MAG: CRISPR-associated endonuclease Cas2 [Coriobacteriales bacterium]|jgi:CRISPR-associated protein Cas2|nr:CRISPR-associated endonuclease Cas2 [Coriobacteriales bacterium]